MSVIEERPYSPVQVRLMPEEIIEAIQELDFTPVFEEAMRGLEQDEQDAFMAQSEPDGLPWQPLATSTIERKGHNMILVDTGRMVASVGRRTPDSIRDTFDEGANKGFTFGTSVEYASFHQEGTSRIPQRRFLGFTEKRIQQIQDDVLEHIIGNVLGEF